MRRAGIAARTLVKREIWSDTSQVYLSASCSTTGIKWCGCGGTSWISRASRSPGAISEGAPPPSRPHLDARELPSPAPRSDRRSC